MRSRSGWFSLAVVFMFVGLMCAIVGCQSKKPEAETPAPKETPKTPDIIDTAIQAGGFTTLVNLINTAGLTETLKGPGPFTVFAPTDDAFAALPPGALNTLVKPENLFDLKARLTYHVVSGNIMAADLANLVSATTLNGKELRITVQGGVPMVNDAKVVRTDIVAGNGIIHVIDKVLVPPKA